MKIFSLYALCIFSFLSIGCSGWVSANGNEIVPVVAFRNLDGSKISTLSIPKEQERYVIVDCIDVRNYKIKCEVIEGKDIVSITASDSDKITLKATDKIGKAKIKGDLYLDNGDKYSSILYVASCYEIGSTGPGGGYVFYLEGGDGKDSEHGWEVTKKEIAQRKTWNDAKAECDKYRGNDLGGWQLPTHEQLQQIADRKFWGNDHCFPLVKGDDKNWGWFWADDTNKPSDVTSHWGMGNNGGTFKNPTDDSGEVIAVRKF